MARPTKLTKAITEKICRSIRAGNYPAVAAQANGVSESTFYRWMEEGRNGLSRTLRDFYEAVKQAEAEGETRAVVIVAKAMSKDHRAAIALLERRHGERWRRRDRVPAPTDERPHLDLSKLSAKELKELEEIVARLAESE